MTRPLLLVTWRDHYTTGGWKEASDLSEQPAELIRSVGWLVAEDEQRLTIIQSVGPEFVRDSLTIEKSCVEKRRVLR